MDHSFNGVTVPTRAAEIAKNIKCLVCNGESVYDSSSSFAIAMRDFINDRLTQGASEKEIISEITTAYGKEAILDPLFFGDNLLLLIVPFLLLLLGIFKIFVNMSNMQKNKSLSN